MSKKTIGSFKDMYKRSGHLGWSDHTLEFHLDEHGPWGSERPTLAHLKNLPASSPDVFLKHHLDSSEWEHYREHGESMAGEAHQHVIQYKDSSDEYNRGLRLASRHGASLRIGSHFSGGDSYGSDLQRGEEENSSHRANAGNIIDRVKGLEKATSVGTPKDMHVFRGIYPQAGIHRLKEGQKFTDHGFTGTSFSASTAGGFGGAHGPIDQNSSSFYSKLKHKDSGAPWEMAGHGIIARIHVPEGTHGHFLDVNNDSEHSYEEEFLLHRGTTFQIDRHEIGPYLNGRPQHVIHMSVVHQNPKPMVNHYGEDEPDVKLVHVVRARRSYDKHKSQWDPAWNVSLEPFDIKKMAKDWMKSNVNSQNFKSFKESVDSDGETMAKVGDQLGSNDGGIHEDSRGDRHYVKFYQNPDQGKVEALAGKIYDHLGIKTVSPQTRIVNGREAVTAKWNPRLEQMHHTEFKNLNDSQAGQVGRMFHAAVLTKNWDMVGLVHDNIVRHKDTGDLYSVDHGGAFHFRARGGPKDYGPDIGEHQSLRHNSEASGDVFHHVLTNHPHAYDEGRKAVQNMDMDHVHSLFKNSGLQNWEKLHDSFAKRRVELLSAPNR